MRVSALLTGAIIAMLCAAAFWVDGSDPGQLSVSAAIVGLAVILHTWCVRDGWLQAGIGVVYLASIALGALGAFLINEGIGSHESDDLLTVSSVITGIAMGWAICAMFLARRPEALKS